MPSLLLIRRVHTHPQPWTVESRHCHRNPPATPLPYRQSICWQPSDLVTCRWAPSRHRNSPVWFCSRDFVTCRSYSSLAVMPFPIVSEFCFIPFCRRFTANILWVHVRRLPSVICRYRVSHPLVSAFCGLQRIGSDSWRQHTMIGGKNSTLQFAT